MTAVEPVSPVMILEGLALHLKALGLVQYSPLISDPAYTEQPQRPALFWGDLDDDPITAIAVNVYDEDRSRDKHNPDLYVQIKGRARGDDMLSVEALMQRFFNVLDWDETHDPEVWPNGAEIQMIRRVSRTPPLPDGTGNNERYDSYRITANPKIGHP